MRVAKVTTPFLPTKTLTSITDLHYPTHAHTVIKECPVVYNDWWMVSAVYCSRIIRKNASTALKGVSIAASLLETVL